MQSWWYPNNSWDGFNKTLLTISKNNKSINLYEYFVWILEPKKIPCILKVLSFYVATITKFVYYSLCSDYHSHSSKKQITIQLNNLHSFNKVIFPDDVFNLLRRGEERENSNREQESWNLWEEEEEEEEVKIEYLLTLILALSIRPPLM